MTKVLLAKIYVDMDGLKLPDYYYSLSGLMEAGYDYEDAKKIIKEKFGVDLEDPMNDEGFEESVSEKDYEKVKSTLLPALKEKLKDVIDSWVAGNDENLLISDVISEEASKLYSETPDDLGWDADVRIFIDVDGKEEEVKGEGF